MQLATAFGLINQLRWNWKQDQSHTSYGRLREIQRAVQKCALLQIGKFVFKSIRTNCVFQEFSARNKGENNIGTKIATHVWIHYCRWLWNPSWFFSQAIRKWPTKHVNDIFEEPLELTVKNVMHNLWLQIWWARVCTTDVRAKRMDQQ